MDKKTRSLNLKKRHFFFEGLLLKLKDLIKLLLNLNIVVPIEDNKKIKKKQAEEKNEFKKVGRNEKCPCGSGKKYKHCHGNI